MKKHLVPLILLGVIFQAAALYAQNDDHGFTVNNDFVTKYLWRGYDVFDDHGAWHPSIEKDLGNGWAANVWGAQPFGSGSENLTELDYSLLYGNTACEGELYQIDYNANYIYYDFPKDNSRADSQEVGVGMSFPNVLKDIAEGLVPRYYIGKFWLSQGGNSGAFHILGLDYGLVCPETGLPINLGVDLTYNDGVLGSDHDWSHFTYKAATEMEVGCLTVTPFIGFQQSMEDTVNKEDEFVGGVSTSFSF
jgi:hypothetical protein